MSLQPVDQSSCFGIAAPGEPLGGGDEGIQLGQVFRRDRTEQLARAVGEGELLFLEHRVVGELLAQSFDASTQDTDALCGGRCPPRPGQSLPVLLEGREKGGGGGERALLKQLEDELGGQSLGGCHVGFHAAVGVALEGAMQLALGGRVVDLQRLDAPFRETRAAVPAGGQLAL